MRSVIEEVCCLFNQQIASHDAPVSDFIFNAEQRGWQDALTEELTDLISQLPSDLAIVSLDILKKNTLSDYCAYDNIFVQTGSPAVCRYLVDNYWNEMDYDNITQQLGQIGYENSDKIESWKTSILYARNLEEIGSELDFLL